MSQLESWVLIPLNDKVFARELNAYDDKIIGPFESKESATEWLTEREFFLVWAFDCFDWFQEDADVFEKKAVNGVRTITLHTRQVNRYWVRKIIPYIQRKEELCT